MELIHLKLFFISFSLVNSFDFRKSNNWERLVNKILESGGDAVKLESATKKWIEQPLDHFDENEKRTWRNKYYEDLSNWQSGGPVILVIGGEGPAYPARYGLTYELAAETNAAVIFSEHRYYGESLPLDTLITPNLKYLTSTQALYDFANLLQLIKSDSKFSSSKIVAIGGSYAGNLAAWIRLLFPQLVDAAISSSAPVLAKKDFFEYFEVVGEVIYKYGSPECYETIANVFNRNKELLKTPEGIEMLKREHNICLEVDFSNKYVAMLFFMTLSDPFMGKVQYADNPTVIQNLCSFTNLNYSNTDKGCFDINMQSYIDSNRHEMWYYQVCTEYGYLQTGNSQKQPFTNIISVELFVAFCKGLYGPEFDEQKIDEGVARINNKFGGLSPNVEKVVFVHGDMDPWSALGIKESLSSDAPVVVINGASHCSDFHSQPASPDARMKWDTIKNTVKSWINL